MCFPNSTRGRVRGQERQRSQALSSPDFDRPRVYMGPGAPTKYPFRTSGFLGVSSLLSLTRRLVATVLAPTPPRGLEEPQGTWLPAKLSPACLSAKSCFLSSTSVWVDVSSPMSLSVSGQFRLVPATHQQTQPAPLLPNPSGTRSIENQRALRPSPRCSQAHREVGSEDACWLSLGNLRSPQVGRLSYHPCLGYPAHHSGLEKGNVVCSMGQAPAAGRTQVHWPLGPGLMHWPTCPVTNTPVPNTGRTTRFQGLWRQRP